jgi:hypothetical protein
MTLQQRIDILIELGNYLKSDHDEWKAAKEEATYQNAWFTPDFIDNACTTIATEFLEKEKLGNWAAAYKVSNEQTDKTVGIVMAGNIPLVGFHDLLCVFISGFKALIKLSSKDEVLMRHLVQKLISYNKEVESLITFSDKLKNCDAYIATGSNNSSRYFDYYFGKYPNIIRRNRTSVAIIDGFETKGELRFLADDIQSYFGLGCRNVTKLYVPQQYDFIPLLDALRHYDYFFEFHKYKHNYDYQLALLIMGNKLYMNNGSVLFTENASPFSAVSCIHYEYYDDIDTLTDILKMNNDIQCVVGHEQTPFGKSQQPTLTDYADGIDTMQFLSELRMKKI